MRTKEPPPLLYIFILNTFETNRGAHSPSDFGLFYEAGSTITERKSKRITTNKNKKAILKCILLILVADDLSGHM